MVRQKPAVLTAGAGRAYLVHLFYHFFRGNARYTCRLEYCLSRTHYQPILLIWIKVGQGPTLFAIGARGFVRIYLLFSFSHVSEGWSGGAMVLGKLPVPGRPTIWITVGQGPTALAVGAGGGV